MGGRCFIPPPSHPPIFSLASSPCSHSIPLPTEAESCGSGFAVRPMREPFLARAGPEPSYRRCPVQRTARQSPARTNAFPIVDCLTCDRRCMSPTSPVPKHGAAGVTRSACTHTCLSIPGALPRHMQAPWRHRWVIPAGVSHWCSSKDSSPGHGLGQQRPFEAAEIYACPEMFC